MAVKLAVINSTCVEEMSETKEACSGYKKVCMAMLVRAATNIASPVPKRTAIIMRDIIDFFVLELDASKNLPISHVL
jgi:hypothetical protein